MRHIKGFNESRSEEELKYFFIELLGEDRFNQIVKRNWVELSEDDYSGTAIQFLEKDGKGDTVTHCSVCYDEKSNKWFSQNCIDSPEIEYDTYEGMRDHLRDIKDKIINNGFSPIYLP